VINYQCPEDAMTYVHRIGRTARAGKSGASVTLVDWDDLAKWKLICDQLNLPFHEPSETYSTSEHLYLELDIPRTAKGTLPRAERTRAGLAAEEVEDLGGGKKRQPRDAAPGRGRDRARSGGSRNKPESGSASARTKSDAGSDGETTERAGSAGRNRRRRRTRSGSAVAGEANAPVNPSTAS
jgi:superfamily II DNA/RNA helicase